jgi:hypothetical protein
MMTCVSAAAEVFDFFECRGYSHPEANMDTIR